jgi:hypothetical protein
MDHLLHVPDGTMGRHGQDVIRDEGELGHHAEFCGTTVITLYKISSKMAQATVHNRHPEDPS